MLGEEPEIEVALSIEDMIAEGDLVVARWSAQVTHAGELEGLPSPTGNQLEVRGITIARIRNGKIEEFWKQQSNPQAS